MAKQIGLLTVTGTVDAVCFYRLEGLYYARGKSSLTGERVKRDPVFAGTMRHAKRMANASKIASAIYRETVPLRERSREKFREVVGMVIKGMSGDER